MTRIDDGTDNSLKARYEDALIGLAFQRISMKEAEALQADLDGTTASGIPPDPVLFSQEAQRRTFRRVEQALRKRQFRHFAVKALPKMATISAAMLLVAFIGLTAAIATVHSVRVRVMRLLIDIEDEYTALSLIEDENSAFSVPAQWNGSRYPSYIPKGFELARIDPWVDDCDAYYQNEKGQALSFSEMGEKSFTNIDTEGATIDSVDINGKSALLSKKGETIFIAWSDFDRYFVLNMDGDEETAVKIARSVKKVK